MTGARVRGIIGVYVGSLKWAGKGRIIGYVVGGINREYLGESTGAKVGGPTGSNVDGQAVSGVRLMGAGVGATGKPTATLVYTGTAVVSMELTLIMRELPVT